MAKLTWSIETTTGTSSQDSPVISDQNMDRFIDYLWTAYPQLNADGSPKNRTALNEANAFKDWADHQWNINKDNVINWEKSIAARAASDAVPDLT